MATHGPESVMAPDENTLNTKHGAVYEEGDSGTSSMLGIDTSNTQDFDAMGGGYEAEDGVGAYETEDNSMVGYGFEAPPTLDPFAKDTSASIYDRPLIDCPYDAPLPEPITAIDDEGADTNGVFPQSEYNQFGSEPTPTSTNTELSSAYTVVSSADENTADIDNDNVSNADTPPLQEEDDSSSENEAPPPPPTVDYDENEDSRQLSEEELLEASKAAEQLKLAMGIDVSGENPAKKKKKGKKSKNKDKAGLVSKTKKKSSRGPSEPTIDDIQPFTLPVDPTANEINDNDVENDDNVTVEADLNSPNDALLFRKPMLDSIEGALGKSGRVRYTCMSASENFVSFGCNTGGVYLFTREKSRFLEVLPSKDGEITALSFGLDEQLLAAGTSNGSIGIWKGPWGSSVTTATLLKVVVEHSESIITSIAWSYDSKRMYSGDQRGLVLATSVTKKPIVPSTTRILPNYKFIHKAVSMALPDSDVVYRCQSPIVQLDVSIAGAVVISSQQQTIIADPHMRQVWIVGAKKPRQGSFGACFGQGSKFPAVYCARPSSRIWIAKSRTGTVSATYNLKDQFTREASPILSSVGQGCSSDAAPVNAKSFAFSKIVIVRENYLLAWTTNTIMIVDSAKARLLGWYSDFKGIIDVSVVGDEIYVLYTGGNENVDNGTAATNFYCDNLALMSPGECATAMATAGNVVDAIEMVLEYFDNATQEKFLENVQQSDLTVLRHLIAGRSESVDVSASPRRKQEEAHEEVLEKKLTEMALTSAQIRMEKENETVQSAESAFMNRIQSTGQELVLDVASDETSDSDASNADIPPPAPPRSVTLQSLKLEGPKFLKKMFAR